MKVTQSLHQLNPWVARMVMINAVFHNALLKLLPAVTWKEDNISKETVVFMNEIREHY
jgi:hypothetical protein